MDEDTKTGGEATMAETLAKAGAKAEEARAAKRARAIRGSHLLDKLLEEARGRGLTILERNGFHLVSGKAKGRKVYVSRRGGRVDLSGFGLKHEAVREVTEEEARAQHLGKVRGMLDFEKPDATVLEAYSQALDQLDEAPPAQQELKIAAKTKPADALAAGDVQSTELAFETDDEADEEDDRDDSEV